MLAVADRDHLEWASRQGRVLFTEDRDFLRLHAAGVAHTGIVYAPRPLSIAGIVSGLMLIYDVLEAGDMEGRGEYL